MAGTTANVLVGGAASVSLATYISAKVVSLTYTDLGYTAGGVTIDPKIELYNVEVDQALGILAGIPKKREMEVKMRFAEVHAENLSLIWNSPTAVLTTNGATNSTLSLMASAGEQSYQLKIVGKGTRGAFIRTATFWKAIPKDIGTLLFKKDDMQGPEVTFMICEDTSGSNTTATFGMIVDT
jgi:hypothetical protein